MIDKLRRRFIAIAMLAVFLVLLSITAFINLGSLVGIYTEADRTIAEIVQNGGHFPKPVKDKGSKEEKLPHPPQGSYEQSPEAPFFTRFFTVTLDVNGNQLSSNTGSIAAVDTTQAMELAAQVVQDGKEKGFSGVYRFVVTQQAEKKLVVFLDCSRDLRALHSFLANSLIVDAVGFAAVSLLIVVFSKVAVRPMVQSYQKQKRFITDAGHELKTPLAIISAANEVLELEHGQSEWTGSIGRQVARLSQLTAQLVSLARMEEDEQLQAEPFDLSQAVEEVAAAFVPLAQAQGKRLVVDVTGEITLTGNQTSLRQVVLLLLDNALKYSTPQAAVSLLLAVQGRHAVLQVHNPAQPLTPGSHPQLFERFYRADASRSTDTGGYGLGLSIVKAVADAHKATVTAHSPDGVSLVVALRLPLGR